MLIKAEEARQKQIDIRKRRKDEELERICRIIQENLQYGKSTEIHKSEVEYKENLKIIEAKGYTIIDSIWYDSSYYLITVDQKEIKDINLHIMRMKIVPVLALIITMFEMMYTVPSVYAFVGSFTRDVMLLYLLSVFIVKAKWRN